MLSVTLYMKEDVQRHADMMGTWPQPAFLADEFLAGYISEMASEVFAVLAEPRRRRVLDLLREAPRPVGELSELLGLSQPGTSKHLRILREAGLVRLRPQGQQHWYELTPGPLAEVDVWLRPYRELWSGRLDALERYLDTRED